MNEVTVLKQNTYLVVLNKYDRDDKQVIVVNAPNDETLEMFLCIWHKDWYTYKNVYQFARQLV